MDDSSLFVLLFDREGPRFSILQLPAGPLAAAAEEDDGVKQPFLSLDATESSEGKRIEWLASNPLSNSPKDLFLFPDAYASSPLPFHGYKYNLTTGCLEKYDLPPSSRWTKPMLLVHFGEHIYFMGHHTRPCTCPIHTGRYFDDPTNSFECYDPTRKSWKALAPIPCISPKDHGEFGGGSWKFSKEGFGQTTGSPGLKPPLVEATALLDDTILLNIDGRAIWAYDICSNKWYPVHVFDTKCYSIQGYPIVWGKTIYALASLSEDDGDLILALSIQKEEIDGDIVFKCSLLSEMLMPDVWLDFSWFKPSPYSPYDPPITPFCVTRHLVRLCNDNFSLVQSCIYPAADDDDDDEFNRDIPIHVTYMKLINGSSIDVMGVRELKTRHGVSEIPLCFSLPKCKPTAFKEGKPSDFKLDPFTEGSASVQEDTPEQEDKEDRV